MLNKLTLNGFTVFTDTELRFASGLNVVIGENVPLNTRVVVTIFVEGGFDDEGDIVREEHQNLIIVDDANFTT